MDFSDKLDGSNLPKNEYAVVGDYFNPWYFIEKILKKSGISMHHIWVFKHSGVDMELPQNYFRGKFKQRVEHQNNQGYFLKFLYRGQIL